MHVSAKRLLFKVCASIEIGKRTAESLMKRCFLKILPERVRMLYVLHILKKTTERPDRADYYFGWIGDKDCDTEISLDDETRTALLEIIKTGQEGKLYFSDHLRTDREILKGAWSLIKYPLWVAQDYPYFDSECREASLRYYEAFFHKYANVFSQCGLIALMDAQLALWEKTKKPYSTLQREIVGRFLPRWLRLTNQLNIKNPKLQLQSKRLNQVLARAKKEMENKNSIDISS